MAKRGAKLGSTRGTDQRAGGRRIEPTLGSTRSGDLRARPDERAGGSAPRSRRRTAKGGGKGKAGGGGGRRGGAPRRRRGLLGRLVRAGFTLAVLGCLAVGGLVAYHASQLPDLNALAIPKRPPSVAIASASGSIFATRGAMGERLRLEELPAHLPQAVMAIEDRRFYSHFGIDPIGLARAATTNLIAGDVVQGGSTLTQQLAKNLFLTADRTWSRKMQELVLALWLEREFSKDRILETYLNRVYLGAGAYGVEAAAQRYFNKSARHVTLGEAAILAGLLRAPSYYAPTSDKERALARASVVLGQMAEAGFIDEAEARAARAEPINVARSGRESSANYAADWVMDLVPGFIGEIEEDVVVSTTIDLYMQDAAQHSLVAALNERGEALDASQGALVALDPSGAVRAVVGGRSYAASQFNRAVDAKRQPGSAFKPFVYLTALEHGFRPNSMVQDAPVSIGGWQPENYNQSYRGAVSVRDALALSLNTVAAQLAASVGPREVARTAHRLGVSSPLEPNASIALGTSETSLLELTTAYAPFANGGEGVIPHVITEIRTRAGEVLYERRAAGLGPVIEPAHVAMMNSMLMDTLIRGTGKRAHLEEREAAGKTGTSQNFRDALFVGYTADLVAGVWMGNDDNSPMKRATGGSVPAEIWAAFMREAHRGVPASPLPGAAAYASQERAVPAPGRRQAGAAPAPQDDGRRIPGAGIARTVDGFLRNLFGG